MGAGASGLPDTKVRIGALARCQVALGNKGSSGAAACAPASSVAAGSRPITLRRRERRPVLPVARAGRRRAPPGGFLPDGAGPSDGLGPLAGQPPAAAVATGGVTGPSVPRAHRSCRGNGPGPPCSEGERRRGPFRRRRGHSVACGAVVASSVPRPRFCPFLRTVDRLAADVASAAVHTAAG
jgi:hypothetical protein